MHNRRAERRSRSRFPVRGVPSVHPAPGPPSTRRGNLPGSPRHLLGRRAQPKECPIRPVLPHAARAAARRIAPPALAASLACAAALAVTGERADGRVALGVQDDELSSGTMDEIPKRLDLLEQSRARVTRVDALWRNIAPTRPRNPADPDDPAYRWERLDAVLRGLALRDITTIITTYTAPAWATNSPDAVRGEVNPIAPRARDFAAFMAALAARYSGRHRDEDGRRLPQVRHLELWNEPNLQAFLAPQVLNGKRFALTRYLQMIRLAYPRIKQVHPDSIVLVGVGGPRSSTSDRGTGSREWMNRILASGVDFDGYSQHYYPAKGPTVRTRAFPAWHTIGQAIEALDRYPKHRGKPYYVTEAGYTTLPTPRRTVLFTEAEQAQYLRQILRNRVVRSDRVPVVMWFNLQDQQEWPGGLLRSDGSARPSWSVFRGLAARNDRMPRPPARRVKVSANQLLVNQRVSQAAVLRANAVEKALDELDGRDIRPGGLRAETFDSSVSITGDDSASATRPLRRSIRVSRPAGKAAKAGSRSAVELSDRQVRINQRVSAAAVRRANALAARIERGLTGADIADGTISADRLAGGLQVTGRGTPTSQPPEPPPSAPSPTGGGGTVKLSAEQLLTNQRIAQAAVLRTNRLLRVIEIGLTSEHFRPGSLGAGDLAP